MCFPAVPGYAHHQRDSPPRVPAPQIQYGPCRRRQCRFSHPPALPHQARIAARSFKFSRGGLPERFLLRGSTGRGAEKPKAAGSPPTRTVDGTARSPGEKRTR
ncbi:unnamed protein product [Ostreobium quekettii]|uniref:C3H1-type domain-containing protein n=1 Tax=Ostreobium quekettii TaxID=121088 RepID=A0A8S1J7H2_9CHLO|nr:unnamed protein product [Ostreobium quekettii]